MFFGGSKKTWGPIFQLRPGFTRHGSDAGKRVRRAAPVLHKEVPPGSHGPDGTDAVGAFRKTKATKKSAFNQQSWRFDCFISFELCSIRVTHGV